MPFALDYLGTRTSTQRLPIANQWAIRNYTAGYAIQNLVNTSYPALFNVSNTVTQQRTAVVSIMTDSVATTLPLALVGQEEKLTWMCLLWFHLMQLPPPQYASVGSTIMNFGSTGNPFFIEV